MATFTIAYKNALEHVGCVITAGTDNISRISNAVNIGLGNYAIHAAGYANDAAHRDVLNGMIVDRFMNREIGQETIEMHKLAMRRKMNEIMPYFNQLFASSQLIFDPLKTVDLSTNSTTNTLQTNTNEATSTGEQNTNSASRSVNSETPQTMLQGNADYATSAADANAQGVSTTAANDNSTQTANAENEVDTTVSGYQAAPSDLIMRYRESLINIELMIINELEDLFMLVWDNGDSYSNENSYLEGFVF
jgi:hypothetical protein